MKETPSGQPGAVQLWAMDWMFDETFDGKRLWVLTVIDSRPTDNAHAESFNAIVRLECLGQHWFLDLDDARKKRWRIGGQKPT